MGIGSKKKADTVFNLIVAESAGLGLISKTFLEIDCLGNRTIHDTYIVIQMRLISFRLKGKDVHSKAFERDILVETAHPYCRQCILGNLSVLYFPQTFA
ncbi:hypothetical protein NPIL_685491 [Nephila pilipes]|uniref:Uncharacterized protein n=1 Tax=Nephila pilipes TaxID=299642 RepID=A0A8X6TZ61_NEPPI|nr:hypothetical protein NPIL_685491 [Nephila pilipes]